MEPESVAVKVENIDGRLGRVEARLNDYAIRIRTSEDFVIAFRAVEAERDRTQALRHQENTEKLDDLMLKVGKKTLWTTVAGVAWTAAGVIVAVIAIIVMIRLAQHSGLDPLKIFTSTPEAPALSSNQLPQQSDSR